MLCSITYAYFCSITYEAWNLCCRIQDSSHIIWLIWYESFFNEPDTVFWRPSRLIYSHFPFFDEFMQCFFLDLHCFCWRGHYMSIKCERDWWFHIKVTNLYYPTFLVMHLSIAVFDTQSWKWWNYAQDQSLAREKLQNWALLDEKFHNTFSLDLAIVRQ